MSQENLKQPEETYPLENINNKNDETTPLTRQEDNAENNVNETSGVDEKLSLEKDVEAAQTSKRKSLATAWEAAQEMIENPKIRLIVAVIGATLLFLFILVVAIVIIASDDNDDRTYRYIRIVPKPRGPYNLLYYRHGDMKGELGIRSWIDMEKEIKDFLAPYRKPRNATLCSLAKRNQSSEYQPVCLFDLHTIAKKCLEPDYGYMSGQPCIFIVFNNITDWVPQYDSNDTARLVGVECNANTQFDAENIGPMEFTPYLGFSPIYFPFKGQDNYMAPFVALHLPSPTHNVGIGLTCRLIASNLNQNDSTQEPVPFIPFNIFIE